MSEVTCRTIMDILPLYVDEVVSDDSLNTTPVFYNK